MVVCLWCTAISVFDGDFVLRKPTIREMIALLDGTSVSVLASPKAALMQANMPWRRHA